ncbi:hypothetical protein [Consotaella salsifontis]|uniref:Uncharacterized protein n=1 Tax=Consotaella salsifontis TaxID=1365950 RepID=A0A1T4LK65_9HYPH|nr:hypothetical protein [Consotaella salsifontis]SJZ55016.1 hypothetical protein SAMN05428963_101253 [Consotaella salsifontis]
MSEIILAQADFTIPAPRQNQSTSEPPAARQGDNDTPATKAQTMPTVEGSLTVNLLPGPVSNTQIVVGAGLFIVLLAIFFAVKIAVTRGLQGRYVAPGAASETGWLLFAWLSVTSLFLIVAFVGNLWAEYVVTAPAALLSLILLLLFVRKRSVALKTHR